MIGRLKARRSSEISRLEIKVELQATTRSGYSLQTGFSVFRTVLEAPEELGIHLWGFAGSCGLLSKNIFCGSFVVAEPAWVAAEA